jgi:hypothetical protein
LRSIVFDRDADFQNEYQHFYDAGVSHTADFHETFLEAHDRNRTARELRHRGRGAAVGAVLRHRARGCARSGAPANGFSQPYIAAVACGSAFYAFLAILLSATAARRLFGPPVWQPASRSPAERR